MSLRGGAWCMACSFIAEKKNVSSICKCKGYSHFFSKNISIHAILNDQSFNDTLANDTVSFEQLGPDLLRIEASLHGLYLYQQPDPQ